jgi:hypothetical protein
MADDTIKTAYLELDETIVPPGHVEIGLPQRASSG